VPFKGTARQNPRGGRRNQIKEKAITNTSGFFLTMLEPPQNQRIIRRVSKKQVDSRLLTFTSQFPAGALGGRGNCLLSSGWWDGAQLRAVLLQPFDDEKLRE
jgi:hypothetical protein